MAKAAATARPDVYSGTFDLDGNATQAKPSPFAPLKAAVAAAESHPSLRLEFLNVAQLALDRLTADAAAGEPADA